MSLAETERGNLRFILVKDPVNPLGHILHVDWMGATGEAKIQTGQDTTGGGGAVYDVYVAIGQALECARLRRAFQQTREGREAIAEELVDKLEESDA